MEEWKKWVPSKDVPAELLFQSIKENNNGLEIVFYNGSKTKRISFIFDGALYSYRNTEEGIFLKTLDYLHKLYGPEFYNSWCLFKVRNSEYLQWLETESLGAYTAKNIEHYVFYTSDVVLEVLSPYKPKIEISDFDQ